MKEIISLTKIFINESIGFSKFFYNKANNKKEYYKQLFTMIIVSVVLVPGFFMYFSFMIAMYAGLRIINQTSVFLSVGYILAVAFILIFGIMYVLSEFYFSKNIEELIPLPITPRKLIISKFFSIAVFEYLFTAFIFVPVLVIYGVGEGMGFTYVFLSILVFLTLPILPLALMTAFIMVLMQSSSLKGRRDAVQIVFILLGTGLILGVQIWLGTQMGNGGEMDFQMLMNNLLLNNESLLNKIGYFAPTSFLLAWALNKITLMSFLWVAVIIAVNFLAFALMLLVGERVYIKSIISGKVIKKGKKLSRSERKKVLGKKSHGAMAIFTMDLRLLLRTPIYFFNNVSVVIIAPVCILISLSFIQFPPEDLKGIKDFYTEMPLLFNYLLIAFFIFFGSTSATTATTFSREGKASWLTRMIPVASKDQIIGRTGVAVAVQSLGIAFTLIAVYFYLPLTPLSLIITVILGISGSLPILLFGLFMDMNRPLLDWDNPQKVVKNNMNVVITLFVGMAYTGLLIAASGFLGYFVNPWLGYGVFLVISGVLTFVFYKLVNNRLEVRLLNFE